MDRERKLGLKKLHYLDWIRTTAVLAVAYGHFVSVATYATSLPSVISEKNELNLPWIPVGTHVMDKFDLWLGQRFQTSTAAIGVVLFFWLAGYLTAMTREKYTGKEFIQKRIIRIYPGLFISVISVGVIAYLSQGIKYPFEDYFFNATLLYPFFRLNAIIGVLWTLSVEFIFDIIAIHIKKFDLRNIFIAEIIITTICFRHIVHYSAEINYIIYFIKYIPLIFFGAALYEVTQNKKWKTYILAAILFFLGYGNIYIMIKNVYTAETAYASIYTYIFAAFIWCTFKLMSNKNVKWIVEPNKVIGFIGEISFLFYLLQLNVGLLVMYYIKIYFTTNAYIIVLGGIVATVAVSAIIHYGVEKRIQKALNKKL